MLVDSFTPIMFWLHPKSLTVSSEPLLLYILFSIWYFFTFKLWLVWGGGIVLICISLMTTEVQEFFSRLLENYISYFIVCLLKSLTHVFYWIFFYHLYEFFTYSKYESFVICISSISPPLTSSDEQILRLMLFNLSMSNLSCFLLLKSFLTPVKCRCSFMLSLCLRLTFLCLMWERSHVIPHIHTYLLQ